MKTDVVILGGGAAGLMCAITAGRRGRSVLVLDHADRLGKKILISGGGRCNFTNTGASPAQYRSQNPHFCTSALARYRPQDFLALVEAHGIAWHEKTLGQLFCDGSAKEIVALLLAECASAGVTIRCSTRIDGVERSDAAPVRFTVATDDGPIAAESVVLATGGLSIPTIGASDLGYRLARHFGLPVVRTDPALVPFTLPGSAGLAELSGIAIDVTVSCNGKTFAEALLFTHAGLSGPAILQISTWWNPGDAIVIDLLPGRDAAAWLRDRRRHAGAVTLAKLLGEHLPKRFVQHWGAERGLDRPVGSVGDVDLDRLAHDLQAWTLTPSGTEGYRKAEVTRGGIDTNALSSKTMEARSVPGLYAIGEVVDVTGWLGGYNFQWAWASGHCAGLVV